MTYTDEDFVRDFQHFRRRPFALWWWNVVMDRLERYLTRDGIYAAHDLQEAMAGRRRN